MRACVFVCVCVYNDTIYNQRNMQECDKRNSHISNKVYMIHISPNSYRHPVTKTFNPLHYTSPNYTSLHFAKETLPPVRFFVFITKSVH